MWHAFCHQIAYDENLTFLDTRGDRVQKVCPAEGFDWAPKMLGMSPVGAQRGDHHLKACLDSDASSVKLDFIRDPNETGKEKLVFIYGGDVMDRGPGNLRILAALVDLKLRYPENVVLIKGNRDVTKMQIPRDVDESEWMSADEGFGDKVMEILLQGNAHAAKSSADDIATAAKSPEPKAEAQTSAGTDAGATTKPDFDASSELATLIANVYPHPFNSGTKTYSNLVERLKKIEVSPNTMSNDFREKLQSELVQYRVAGDTGAGNLWTDLHREVSMLRGGDAVNDKQMLAL